ncbi:MFS transporter [Nocardioides baekrokdamisoli]|uniref:MFS transporter n=1 Tax=Nocardioides baekrokdamisoli TaxID=1804624 RepID=UPI000F76E461|nr:MFS transporter [Nocardioides baekrokdamisoli]
MSRIVSLGRTTPARTILIVLNVSLALHLLWLWGLATTGGDLAAQDFWAEQVRAHPGIAYNFAWYGGLPPVSYSAITPYVMGHLGVRPTGVICGVISSVIMVLILRRMIDVRHVFWPSMVAMLALWCNTVSGRITFSFGLMFALATLWALVSQLRPRWLRAALIVIGAVAATAGSAVAGLFLGLLAGGLWLSRRRTEAYLLGIPPAAYVVATTFTFPFQGDQPYPWYLVLPTVVAGYAVWATAPREWKWVRRGSLVYIAAVFGTYVITSPIGSNIDRMAMIFAPVILVVTLESGRARSPFTRFTRLRAIPVWGFVAFMSLASFSWNFIQAGLDLGTNSTATVLDTEQQTVVKVLQAHHAATWMVEFVPTASHRESSEFASSFNMVRGWNRQADKSRNALFYDPSPPLTPEIYNRWLHRWPVGFVVLPPGNLDYAAKREGQIVASEPSFLRLVWSDNGWRVYAVQAPTPVIAAPGVLAEFESDHLTVRVPHPGSYLIRVYYAGVLAILDPAGDAYPAPKKMAGGAYENPHGCLLETHTAIPDLVNPVPTGAQKTDQWTTLVAPRAGKYVIEGPWSIDAGTSCPTN